MTCEFTKVWKEDFEKKTLWGPIWLDGLVGINFNNPTNPAKQVKFSWVKLTYYILSNPT